MAEEEAGAALAACQLILDVRVGAFDEAAKMESKEPSNFDPREQGRIEGSSALLSELFKVSNGHRY